MKFKTILFAFAAILWIGSMSSCRKAGCVDTTSCNYDPNAKKDDGTCINKGQVTFWQSTAGNGYDIVVTVNASEANIIAQQTSTPLCDAVGCAAFSLCPGSHSYTAHEVFPGTATWSGNATSTEDGCLTVQLD